MNKFTPKTIGILCFDDVDPLVVYGPAEVLSLIPGWRVELLGIDCDGMSKIVSGTQVVNVQSHGEVPRYNLFVIPGGIGLTKVLENHLYLNTVKSICHNSDDVASICAGALVLAAIGILDNKKATTHWASKGILKELFSSIKLKDERCIRDVKKIKKGKNTHIYTSGGVSAGIDLALYYVRHQTSLKERRRIEVLMEHRFETKNFFSQVKSTPGYDIAKKRNEKMMSHVIVARKEAIKKYLDSVRKNK